jgi:hypothetical protein
MIHLLAFVLCLAGFAALALAVRRQQREIIGRWLRPTTAHALRAAGVCALLLALGLLVASAGWGLGLVMFSGHTTLAAGVVYCGLFTCARAYAPSIKRG